MFNSKKRALNPFRNKRTYPRLNVYHLAKYKLTSDPDDKEPILAYLKNIGGGGVCLQTNEMLPASATIHLIINLPGIDQPVTSMARICWVKKIGKHNNYEYGIQFLEIDDIARQSIIGRINSINKKLTAEKK